MQARPAAPPPAGRSDVVAIGFGINVPQRQQQQQQQRQEAAAGPRNGATVPQPHGQAAQPTAASAAAAAGLSPQPVPGDGGAGAARPPAQPPPPPVTARHSKRQRALVPDPQTRQATDEDARYGGAVPLWYTRAPGPPPIAGAASPPTAVAGGFGTAKRARLGFSPGHMGPGGTRGPVDVNVSARELDAAGLREAGRQPAGSDTAAAGAPPAAAGPCSSDLPVTVAPSCDASTIPRPREPPPEAAPYGELLYSARRMGYDLCRRAQDPGSAAAAGGWHPTWVRVLLRLRAQLRRRLHTRSTVSKFSTGICPRTQPLANHAQLRAAVELLLLLVTELPPSAGAGPRPRVAPEAMDAVEHLLCFSPFVDFGGSDPQARAVLVDGALQLARLAAARSLVDAAWRGVLDMALDRLTDWLLLQRATARDMRASGLGLALGGVAAAGGGVVGGLRWEAAGAAAIPDPQRHLEEQAVQQGHQELLRSMLGALTPLVRFLGPPLARRLLSPHLVATLTQPAPPPSQAPPCCAEALALLHAALLALAPDQPLGHLAAAAASAASGASGGAAAGVGVPHAADGGSALGEICEVVLQSGLRAAVEAALRTELKQEDPLLPLASGAVASGGLSIRDAAVPLLGSLYAALYARGALPCWAAVECAAWQAASEGAPTAQHSTWRRAWEARGDRRARRLALHVLAHTVRALGRLGLGRLVAPGQLRALMGGALRADAPAPAFRGPAVGQLGLLGAWLRGALDCGCGGRGALAALTAELLTHSDEARRLFGCSVDAGGTGDAAGGSDSTSGGAGGAELATDAEVLVARAAEALDGDADGTFRAQMAAALMSGLVREHRLSDIRGVLCGLDLTWAALWEDLPAAHADSNSGGGAAPAAQSAATEAPPPPLPPLPPGTRGASRLPESTLLAHRAMAAVVLAAMEPCAAGSLSGHPAVQVQAGGGGNPAAWRGPGPAPGPSSWAELQGAVAPLRDVVRAAVVDAAALTHREGALGAPAGLVDPSAHMSDWGRRLWRCSAAGLLPHLFLLLARSADARTDLVARAANPGEPSVLQRCLAVLSLMVCELPGPDEEHAATNNQLRLLAVAAVLDPLGPAAPLSPAQRQSPQHPHPQHHLQLPPQHQQQQQQWGAGSGDCGAAVRDNLARLLHRCVAGSMRHYVVAGLQAAVQTAAPPRHASNALSWLRALAAHPAMRCRRLVERLLPPLLHLLVEGLSAAREHLLAAGILKHDSASAGSRPAGPGGQPAAQQPPPPRSQQGPSRSTHLALVGELLATAVCVLRAAAASDLVAEPEEARGAPLGAVRIDSSPLLLMEPAPLAQVRAAAGCTAGLLARTCLECFALPFDVAVQRTLLDHEPPGEAERAPAVSRRLQSSFGNPPALTQGETPGATRQTCGEDVRKLAMVKANEDGADAALKLSQAAVSCLNALLRECGPAGEKWTEPALRSFLALVRKKKELGFQLSTEQLEAIRALLRRGPTQQGPAAANGQQGPQPGSSSAQPQPQPHPQLRETAQPGSAQPGTVLAAQQLGAAGGAAAALELAQGGQPAAVPVVGPAAMPAARSAAAKQVQGGSGPAVARGRSESALASMRQGAPAREAGVSALAAAATYQPAQPPALPHAPGNRPADHAAAAPPGAGAGAQLPRGAGGEGSDGLSAQSPPQQQQPRRPHAQAAQQRGGAPRAQDPGLGGGGAFGAQGPYQAGSGARQASPPGDGDPPGRPQAHFTSAESLPLPDDHVSRLAGCRPLAELPSYLAGRAPNPPPQQQQQQMQTQESQGSQRSAYQAGSQAGARGAASQVLPPIIGQVLSAKLQQVAGNPCLTVRLRDASVTTTPAVFAFVVGPKELLEAVKGELDGHDAIVGIYGARNLSPPVSAGSNGGTAAAQAFWPLKCRLTLGGDSSTRACGMVVEPRTVYAMQLRRDLLDLSQRAAAPTVRVGGTPVTAPAIANRELRQGRLSDAGPSQQTEAAFVAAPAAARVSLAVGERPMGQRRPNEGRVSANPRPSSDTPPSFAAAPLGAGAAAAAEEVTQLAQLGSLGMPGQAVEPTASPYQRLAGARGDDMPSGLRPAVPGAFLREAACEAHSVSAASDGAAAVEEAAGGAPVHVSAWRGILAAPTAHQIEPRDAMPPAAGPAAAMESGGGSAAAPGAGPAPLRQNVSAVATTGGVEAPSGPGGWQGGQWQGVYGDCLPAAQPSE